MTQHEAQGVSVSELAVAARAGSAPAASVKIPETTAIVIRLSMILSFR
jgi:hypothetical protein